LNEEQDNAYSKRESKLEVINEIREKVDFDFDKFRQDFFSKLEPDEAVFLKNVKLVSKLIPYWEAESILNE